MQSTFFFFGGCADLFLSMMLWTILEKDKKLSFFIDGDRIYSVTDVVRQNSTQLNYDCPDIDDESIE